MFKAAPQPKAGKKKVLKVDGDRDGMEGRKLNKTHQSVSNDKS